MNNNFEQVTENEFDGMTMEEKKKYLIDLVSNMSGNEVETVFYGLKEDARKQVIPEIKEANSADAIADEKIDSIASWLDVAAMGESTSKIDVFKSICADENIHLNETFMKKMYERLS